MNYRERVQGPLGQAFQGGSTGSVHVAVVARRRLLVESR